MGGNGIEGGDVGETELTKRILEHGDACFGGGGGVRRRVDGFDDFVDLG